MTRYLCKLYPLLDRRTRRDLIISTVLMLGLALLEAGAVLMLAPLLTWLTTGESGQSAPIRMAQSVFRTTDGARLAFALAVCVATIFVVKNIVAVLVLRWNATFGLTAEAGFARRLTRLYLRAPYVLHLRRNSAQFQYILNSSLRSIFGHALLAVSSSIGDLASAALITAVLVATDPIMTLVLAVYLTSVTVIYRFTVSKKTEHVARLLNEIQPREIRFVSQAITSAKHIQISHSEDMFADQIHATRMESLPAQRTIAFLGAVPRHVLELAMLGAAVVMAVVAFSTQDEAQAAATVALFLAGGLRILTPANKVLGAMTTAQAVTPALELVSNDLRDFSAYEEVRPDAADLEALQHISVRDLTFAYDEGGPVLRDVDLEIDAGSTVALVGGSGAGKSTLTDILLGVLDPQAGAVTINGHPLSSVRNQWQQMIGYVPQTIPLLDDTVRTNVAMGVRSNEIDDAQVWRALGAAQLTEVVAALPNGLDTSIGEAGVRLSGGQRQRLGIARALYHSPQMLFLDEATSALDTVTESEISAVLKSLHGQVTIVLIAHRLSTVKHADRIHFMQDGRIVDSGSFDVLASVNSGFARLVELSDITVST